MSDFGASVLINVPAEQVFDFASKPENMPEYLDSITYAQRLGEGRIRIGGTARGQNFEANAWLDIDDHHLMMRWVAEGSSSYMGHLTVTPMDAFSSKAEVHLICDAGSQRKNVQAALDQAVDKIKELCETNANKIPAEFQLGNKRYMG